MSNDLPARWRDDDEAPAELREIGTALQSLDQPPPAGARARVWAEIEGGQRRPRGSSRLVWVGAAAVAVLALLWAPRLLVPDDVARVEVLVGSAGLERNGVRADIGQAIRAGTRLTTKNGRAVVRLLDVGVAYLSESTEAVVGTAAESILLARGTVVTEVRPRPDAPAFHVVAGDYDVRVVGTLFAVSRDGEHVTVRVERGKVEVRGPQGITSVGAGESFSSRGAPVAPIATEAVDLLVGRTVSMVRDEETPEPEPRVAEPRRPPMQRQAAAETATEPETRAAPEAVAEAQSVEALPAAETAPAVPENEKYVEAVGSEDTERAIALFDELIAGGGPRAELAAYQAARLSRSRDLNEAIGRYEQLLSAHPRGVFGQEARLDVIECAMQLGKWKKAAYHIDVFLDAYPDSERTAEVRFLRAEVARHGHDCAAAIADYDAALSSPRRVGDAMFFKAWCLLSYEKTAAALPLLERYLERFPTGRHAKEARERVAEIRALKND